MRIPQFEVDAYQKEETLNSLEQEVELINKANPEQAVYSTIYLINMISNSDKQSTWIWGWRKKEKADAIRARLLEACSRKKSNNQIAQSLEYQLALNFLKNLRRGA